jgi:hypothetical protein
MGKSSKKFYKRVKFWLWISVPILLALLIINGPRMEQLNTAAFVIIVILFLGYFFILFFSSIRHFYNSLIIAVLLGLVGWIFKLQHFPGAGPLIVLGFSGLAFGSIYSSLRILKNVKNSLFLKWYGFAIGFVLFAFSIGLLFKTMNYPYGTSISYASIFFFIIAILAMVFTLPSSNYIDWTRIEKRIFYRSIILPMIFLVLISSYIFNFRSMMQDDFYNTEKENPFYMDPIELLNKPGI